MKNHTRNTIRKVPFLLLKQGSAVLWCFVFVLVSCTTMAQEVGRYNRFQYHQYKWRAYHSKAFNIYFPANAADGLYRYLVKETPEAMARIKKATIKELPKNINIVIYPSIDQLYETNIGAWEPQEFTIPTFNFKGTRIVLAYNGSYADLKLQLNEALARALWEAQMKDGDKEEPGKNTNAKISNAAKNDAIPFWFKEGAIRFFANGWAIADEDKFRNSFEQNHFTTFEQVLQYQPRLAGQAFCYFLTQEYYPKVVAQLFFQVKKKKSLPRGLRLVTKHEADTLYKQCFEYYCKRFKVDSTHKTNRDGGMSFHHKNGIVLQVLTSQDKSCVAYVLFEKGNRNVYLYNAKDGSTLKVASYKLPPWINGHSSNQYPLIQWHPDGRQLFVAKPRKGKVEIGRYTLEGLWQETNIVPGVDGITTFKPLSDREFLLTAYCKGQSDIVTYDDNHEKFMPFTDDEYDDALPVFTNKKNEVILVSERPEQYQERKTYLIGVGFKKDTLRQGIYWAVNNKTAPVVIDSVEHVRWDKLVPLKDNKVLATTTKYGRETNVLLDYSTGNITQLNAYSPYQYLDESSEIASFLADKDSVYITRQPLDSWIKDSKATVADTMSPWLADHQKIMAEQAKEDSLLNKGKDTTHYFMDDVFASRNFTDTTKQRKRRRSAKKPSYPGEPNVEPYILQLHSAYFTAKVNNDYFINRYQPFLNYQGEFKFPEVGGITKGGFTDLLENHHFTIAYKLPAATEGSDFFIRYENTEKKVDWGFSYFRKVETLKPDPKRNWVDENGNKYPGNAKGKTHNYELFVKYPLSLDCYIGAQQALRQDRTVFLATDKYSLDFLPIQTAWSITTFSYNLDKLKPTIPNLFKGYKAEVFVDLFKGFSQSEAFVFGSTVNLSYHQPIFKYITLVSQLHAGYSGGDEKVLYNMGGTDNNVTPQVDTSVHFAQNLPYAFQTLVTPFRGYYQNSLYGNQYLLLNFDAYFPLFQTLIPIETPLPFINNLQLGAFTDMGTAKEKWYNYSVSGKWLQSYGISARTTLSGYPLRLDLAWPGTFNKKPVVYFSLKL